MEIDFRSHGLPSLVQPDVSICLFRVLQEALHNGVKHSGVQKFACNCGRTMRFILRLATPALVLTSKRQGEAEGLV